MIPLLQTIPVKRLRKIHDALATAYGPQHWWPAKTSFEIILGAYLTQNTSWKAVEKALTFLHGAKALTPQGLRALSLTELQDLIRPAGFVTRKAPALKAFLSMLDTEFGGSLKVLAALPTDKLRTRFLALPGVGPETADAILLYALGHPVPMADEYLRRIVERHKLLPLPLAHNSKTYNVLTQLTREAFAHDPENSLLKLYNEFHALTIAVGKAHCGKVANCTNCPLFYDLQKITD